MASTQNIGGRDLTCLGPGIQTSWMPLAAPNLGVFRAVVNLRLVDAIRVDVGRHIVLGDDVEGLDEAAGGGAIERSVQLIDRLPALKPGGFGDRADLIFAGLDALVGGGAAVGTDERDA